MPAHDSSPLNLHWISLDLIEFQALDFRTSAVRKSHENTARWRVHIRRGAREPQSAQGREATTARTWAQGHRNVRVGARSPQRAYGRKSHPDVRMCAGPPQRAHGREAITTCAVHIDASPTPTCAWAQGLHNVRMSMYPARRATHDAQESQLWIVAAPQDGTV